MAPVFDALGYGGPRRNIAIMFGAVKLEWLFGYQMMKKFEDMFTRFDTIHKRDRQTDRRTYTAQRHRSRCA